MGLTIVSINAGKCMGDEDALDLLISDVERATPHWAMIFISEFDGVLDDREFLYRGMHAFQRHWPGHGSTPMAFLVNTRIRRFFRSFSWHGRAVRVHLNDYKDMNISVVGVHGGHGEALGPSLADAAFLCKTRRRGSEPILIGDFNVDQLPEDAGDHWSALPDRRWHDFRERSLLDEFRSRLGLHLEVPRWINGIPSSSYAEAALTCAFSRIPVGEQLGWPALLDYCLARRNAVRDVWVDWNNAPADHAFLVVQCYAPYHALPRRPKKTWRCSDFEECVQWAAAHSPDRFDDSTGLVEFVTTLQSTFAVQSTAAERRCQREPPHIKELRVRLRHAMEERERRHIQLTLVTARKQWLQSLKASRVRDKFESGRPLLKSKKLFPITAIIDGALGCAPTVDPDACASAFRREFVSKWGCRDFHQLSLISDVLRYNDGVGMQFDVDELHAACDALRKPSRLDRYQICASAFKAACLGAPHAIVELLHRIVASQTSLAQLQIHGHASGKRRGPITSKQVRAILPLPIILAVIDAIMAKKLNSHIDKFAACTSNSFFECARRGRQILDLTFALSQVIEKAGDLHGYGAIAQADIRQYYDNIRPLRAHRWMLRNGATLGLSLTFLRFHCVTQLRISVMESIVEFATRSVGVLTGTRSAAAVGRIPLLDIAAARTKTWEGLAFKVPGVAFCLGTFVDNLFSTGATAHDAVAILEDVEAQLLQKWHLRIGTESKIVLPAAGQDVQADELPGWKLAASMRCLGHILTSNSAIAEDWHDAVKKVWAAYFSNMHRGFFDASLRARLDFLNNSMRPVLRFRWSRWPYQTSYASRLDSLQRHLIAKSIVFRPQPGEDVDTYFRRRTLHCSRIAAGMGLWSTEWKTSLRLWRNHIERAHDPGHWSGHILHWHSVDWLQSQRVQHSSGGFLGRTRTRISRGTPAKRWMDSFA